MDGGRIIKIIQNTTEIERNNKFVAIPECILYLHFKKSAYIN